MTYQNKPGVWFFSLDTSSRIAVEAARRTYRLPYFHARTVHERRGGRVEFSNARRERVFEITYRDATTEAFEPQPGSLEHLLTERYCLYAADEEGLHRADIHHPPWRLCPAEATIDLNTMPPEGVELEGKPLLHLAERQDVVIWPLEKIPAN